ncbi:MULTISPECIES: calcium/sodium antiporter [Marivita]|uniref:Calcium/sodium antiporter n=1 Tax=Marivita cryptomonadis TaxID=505252 RepID=A0A9Q2RY53_9RHOB|nr:MULTISPECIES: calcium/sodium antiporter [Marivita]MBM2319779.1 calcium/sodium antiporter [Marivita cryptomonadis]MBM2329358.1 calcium/sodium antiporter [Marivita cryptomonadis]MBM2338946.1 calcium/sodium antiporter [Marivita cryptomonadis]MBM2343604.1 calcium/sodium antiporter [Marivita cryptomonadis]MBM2348281.1 calcium/sodium antiporter [Marivita cryptomonadis]
MIWGGVVIGLVILLLAGDALVKGAVNLSLRIGIPALIVSLTVVAFGTSAPELLISIKAAMENVPGIALGNVVGSNTANVLLVLGIPALLAVMHTSECDTRKSYVIMLASSVLFIALAFRGVFDWTAGIVLLVVLAVILGDAMREALAHRRAGKDADDEEEPEGADPDMPWWKIILYLALGLVGLPLGADLLVDSAVEIATIFGVSDTVIGLTLVALGTSLPELATTVMAALRRQADVALGNVIGSNMFNLLAIIGVASLIAPIPVDPEFLRFDLWVMLGASLLIFPLVFLARDLTRIWGVVLSALYLGYIALVIM